MIMIKVECANCGTTFEKYFQFVKKVKNNFCSNNCKNEWKSKHYTGKNNPFFGKKHTKETKEEISKQLKKHSKDISENKKGNKNPMYGKMSPRYKELDNELIINLYREGWASRPISDLFDVDPSTIIERLKEFGIETRKPWFGTHMCKDGHVVKSSYELIVDNWMFDHQIQHLYEPYIGNCYHTDFKVGENFIEIFGITNNKKYDNRRDEKIKYYEEHNLNLIAIYPKDIAHLQEKLLDRLISFSNQKTLCEVYK